MGKGLRVVVQVFDSRTWIIREWVEWSWKRDDVSTNTNKIGTSRLSGCGKLYLHTSKNTCISRSIVTQEETACEYL